MTKERGPAAASSGRTGPPWKRRTRTTSTRPTAVPDPDDHYDTEWFDHTGLACYDRAGYRRPSGHLTHRPDGRCNWCPEFVKPALVLDEDLELDDVCVYSSHDRRVRPLERMRAGLDVDDAEALDDIYGIDLN